MKSKESTVGRLRAALERLVTGKPLKVKLQGRLTLNKINNEAGLGNSYIHKFTDFVKNEAKPAIEEYNSNYDPIKAKLLENEVKLTDVEKIKAKLKKEVALKERYRKERYELNAINKELETKNSTLMFRLYELQEQINIDNVINLSR
jgi:hypothetical protein